MTQFEHRKLGLALAFTASLTWGVLAIALKYALVSIPLYNVVWFRFVFASIVLLCFFGIKDRSQIKLLAHPPKKAIIAGLFLAANYIGFLVGVKYTSASNSQVIIQSAPLMLAMCGFFIYKEAVSRNKIIGYLIATVGFVIYYKSQLMVLVNDQQFHLGNVYIFMAAIAWVIWAILQKKLVLNYDPQFINLVVYITAFISLSFLPDYSHFLTLNLEQFLLLCFLGANTIVAYGAMGASLKYAAASEVSLMISMTPLITFAIVALMQLFNISFIPLQSMSIMSIVGAIVIVSGVGLVVTKG
ncbi:MAG: DMT family transporter [Candidatus Cloacimonetes bacterium]|nr:DMT family transporter [Candidatus Cloacimonadota bacterium]